MICDWSHGVKYIMHCEACNFTACDWCHSDYTRGVDVDARNQLQRNIRRHGSRVAAAARASSRNTATSARNLRTDFILPRPSITQARATECLLAVHKTRRLGGETSKTDAENNTQQTPKFAETWPAASEGAVKDAETLENQDDQMDQTNNQGKRKRDYDDGLDDESSTCLNLPGLRSPYKGTW